MRLFDWGGMALLSSSLISLLFYTSSRAVTGVAAFQDLRLLGSGLFLLSAFVYWERRYIDLPREISQHFPYVDLTIFANRTFTLASICAALRLVSMSNFFFLIPLYLTEIHGFTATAIGLVLLTRALGEFALARVGGQIVDRYGSRWPAVVGLAGLGCFMVYLIFLSAPAAQWRVIIAVAWEGMFAGLSLTALHRAALRGIAQNRLSGAAGLYSLLRYTGFAFGTALAGIALQSGFDRGLLHAVAYQNVLWLLGSIALLGSALSWFLGDSPTELKASSASC